MAVSKRIEWLDLCKCTGIILVILGHCPLSPSKIFYFYAFHIPLFFILAGYTLNISCTINEYVIKKFKSLIVPYFAFSIICLTFNYSMGVITGDTISLKEESYKILFNQRANHLWFLLVLFFSDLAIFFVGKLRLLSNATMAIVSFCAVIIFACFFMRRYSVVLYWNLDIVPIASVFVLTGYLYRHFIEPKLHEANRWLIVAICILATCCNFSQLSYLLGCGYIQGTIRSFGVVLSWSYSWCIFYSIDKQTVTPPFINREQVEYYWLSAGYL